MKSRGTRPPPNTTEDIKTIMNGLRRIMKVLRDSSQLVEDVVGVTSAQLFVLQTLDREPSLSINDLAARAFTHQSSVSVVVAKLVSAGYVRRTPSMEDRRSVMLTVSAKGKALLRRAPLAAQNTLIANIAQMAAADRHALRTGLEALAGTFKQPKGSPPMFFEN